MKVKKTQSIKLTKKYQTHEKLKRPNWRAKRGYPFAFFNVHCCKKIGGDPLVKKKFRKKSHTAEKTERGTLWDFSTSVSVAKPQTIEGGTLWGTFFSQKRSLTRPKKLKGGTL